MGASDPAQEKDSGNSSILLIVGLVSGMAVLILAMAFIFLHRLRHVERKFARLTDAEIRNFREGILEDSGKEQEQRVENEFKIESLPYNPKYEVPRKQISFGKPTSGRINFFNVMKSFLSRWEDTWRRDLRRGSERSRLVRDGIDSRCIQNCSSRRGAQLSQSSALRVKNHGLSE